MPSQTANGTGGGVGSQVFALGSAGPGAKTAIVGPGSTTLFFTSSVGSQVKLNGGVFTNLTPSSAPAPGYNTTTPMFGTANLNGTGYGYTSAFPSWPGAAGTIQAWIRAAAAPGVFASIVDFDNGSADMARIFLSAAGFISIGYKSGGVDKTLTGAINLCDGVKHLLELGLGANGAHMFVDGVLRGSRADVPDAVQGPNMAVSNAARLFNRQWVGETDEVSIWSTKLHTSGYTPPTSPWVGNEANLVALYHLDSNLNDSAAL